MAPPDSPNTPHNAEGVSPLPKARDRRPPHLEVPSEVLPLGSQPGDVLQRGSQLQPDPLQGKRQGESPSAQLRLAPLGLARPGRGSYVPPWPPREPSSGLTGPPHCRDCPDGSPSTPSRVAGALARFRAASAYFELVWVFCPPPPRCACALSQAGRRLPVLSAG